MANLKRLKVMCRSNGQHFYPVRMILTGWAGPYKPVYRCPVCGRRKIFHRPYPGGPILRVG